MRDKIRLASLLVAGTLMVLMTTQCSVYHRLFPAKSSYFTETEIKLLAKTTGAVDFDYGYDADTGLDYVYYYTYRKEDLPAKRKRLASAIAGTEPVRLTAFYEKIYALKIVTIMKMDEYKRREKWEKYTYVRKYLLPPLTIYTEMLEMETLKINRGYKAIIKSRKADIEKKYNFSAREADKINKK